MKADTIIKSYPHRIINIGEKNFIFLGHNAAIFELSKEEVFILQNERDTAANIFQAMKKQWKDISFERFEDILEELEKNNVIQNKKTEENMLQLRKDYSWDQHPDTIILMLCQACNLRCKYCYAGDGEYMNPGIMPEEIGKKAIEFISEICGSKGQFNIIFFGGEPLMDFEKLKNLVQYAEEIAKKKGKTVGFSITTNGTLLNQEVEEFLVKKRFNVTLSLDGGKEVNDENRFYANGKGAYDETVNRTKILRKNGAVGIRGTITHVDVNLMSRWNDLKNLEVKNINFSPSVNMMSDEDYEKLIISYKEAIDKYCYGIRNKQKDVRTMGFVSKIFEKISQGGVRLKNCGAGNNMLAVDKDGNLYPCHRLLTYENYQMGNIFTGLDKQKYSKLEQDSIIDNYEECKNCWLSSFCCGGCVQENLIMESQPNKPYSNYCKYIQEVVMYAIKQYLLLVEEGFINA